jgi:hypothetical protein
MERLDRRQTARFKLKIPFWIRLPKSPETPACLAKASNISGTGLYFVADPPLQGALQGALQVGTPVEMTLRMPEVVVGKHSREWRCRGRVVRVKPNRLRGVNWGVGVEFQYYDVLKNGIPRMLTCAAV